MLHFAATVGMLTMALLSVFVRTRSASRPVTVRGILLPPLGMSTGFIMFLFPFTHIPWSWAIAAWLAGALLFSLPLIAGTRFETSGDQVYVRKSKSFAVILLVLLSLRLLLHSYVERYVSLPQTGALFFMLAFGMILPWRLAMLYRYRKLTKGMEQRP